MTIKTTEHLHDSAAGLDQLPAEAIAALLADGQAAAAAVVQSAVSEICNGAVAMAETIQSGGCLHYAAAGSSGLMAAADAQELGGTFSISPTQLRIHMAGGLPTGVELPGDTEDSVAGLEVALSGLGKADTLVAVSASGTTPFTVAAAKKARAKGATVIGIANNRDTALLSLADHPILLPTPPEVLSGSTRMGAGTAQKIALNMLSTLMAVNLGHVHDGMMVNLRADNNKLRARAVGIVSQIAKVLDQEAAKALERTGGEVKPAIIVAVLGVTPDEANSRLAETKGHLRPALGQMPE